MDKGKLLKSNINKKNNETKYPIFKYGNTNVIKNKEKRPNKENLFNPKDKKNTQIKTYDKSEKRNEKVDKNGNIIKKIYNNCNIVEIKVTSKKNDYIKKNSICQSNRKITTKCKNSDKNNDSSHKKPEESKNKMICLLHKKNCTYYCKKCSKYICTECLKIHIIHKIQITELSSISFSRTEKELIEKNKKFNYEVEFLINDIKRKIADNNNNINASLKSGITEEDKYIDNFLSIDKNDLYKRGLFLLSLFYKDKNNKNSENNENSENNKNNTTYDKYKIINNSFTLMGNYFNRKQKLKIEKSNNIEISKNNEFLKLDNVKLLQEIQCDSCITSITVLKNLNLLATFKGGHAKVYQKDNNNQLINYKEVISIDEDEYCFNYCIELFNQNVCFCSQDCTIKIIELDYVRKNYNTIQRMENNDRDPIFIIKELNNNNLICGTWKSIILYQYLGNSKYELITKYLIRNRTFSILEIKPNIIVSTQCYLKTIKFINVSNFEEICEIKDIPSNEHSEILCKMSIYNKEIICIGNNNGVNIVDFGKKKVICNVNLIYQTTSLTSFSLNNNDYLIIGAKSSNKARTMFKFYFLNVLLKCDKNGEIKSETISIFEPMHYYDINSMKLFENKDRKIFISTGNEDKRIKIWDLLNK